MYLQRAFEIIEIIPEDKSGLYWKEEITGHYIRRSTIPRIKQKI